MLGCFQTSRKRWRRCRCPLRDPKSGTLESHRVELALQLGGEISRDGDREGQPIPPGSRTLLISKLREHDLSRRRSLRVLNFIFEEMKQALARDEEVGFPCGKLLRVKS